MLAHRSDQMNKNDKPNGYRESAHVPTQGATLRSSHMATSYMPHLTYEVAIWLLRTCTTWLFVTFHLFTKTMNGKNLAQTLIRRARRVYIDPFAYFCDFYFFIFNKSMGATLYGGRLGIESRVRAGVIPRPCTFCDFSFFY